MVSGVSQARHGLLNGASWVVSYKYKLDNEADLSIKQINTLGTPSVKTIISNGGIFEYSLELEMARSILSKWLSSTSFNTAPVGVHPCEDYESRNEYNNIVFPTAWHNAVKSGYNFFCTLLKVRQKP